MSNNVITPDMDNNMSFNRGMSLVFFVLLSSAVLLMSPMVLSGEADDQAKPKETKQALRALGMTHAATRVIALAPHLVEAMYTVGAGDKLLAAVSHSDYPKAALALPRVGNYTNINIESVLRFKPDLVLAWRSGNGPKVISKLRQLGIPVYVSEPGNLLSIAAMLKDVGTLVDGKNTARARNAFLSEYETLRAKYQNKNPVSVFYQVWNKPLQTLSNKSIVSDVINLCGGRNVFGESKAIAPKVNVEAVLRENPDAIIASGMGEERPEWLDDWNQWTSLTAVEHKHLFFVPPDLIQRHSTRLLQGAAILCQQLDQVRSKN